MASVLFYVTLLSIYNLLITHISSSSKDEQFGVKSSPHAREVARDLKAPII